MSEIEVTTCIQESHGILMKGLMDKSQTPPGQFSTKPRKTIFDNKAFIYPHFLLEEIVFEAVLTVITQYNEIMMFEIPKLQHDEPKIEMTLKSATLLLFGFLTLHLFADGNGRLARLLYSHCLSNFCPFQTSIYNVFSPSTRDDYLRALDLRRKSLILQQEPHSYAESAKQEVIKI